MFIQLPDDHSNAPAAARPRIGIRFARCPDRWVSEILASAPGAEGILRDFGFFVPYGTVVRTLGAV
jgi:hypothetical protein